MNQDARVIRLQEDIFAVRGIWMNSLSFFNTYSYIIRTGKNNELLLVDTCGPGSGRYIKEAVLSMGRSVSDITGIALTHWHKDHTGALAEVVSMAGSPGRPVNVFIHKSDSGFLLSQRTRLLTLHPFLKLKVPHSPGKLPEDNLFRLIELDHESGANPLGGYGIEFIHTPGHTPGHTSFIHKKTMSLFSGCGLSFFGNNTAGIVSVFHNREQQIRSARMLADAEFTFLYPAHLGIRSDEIKKERRIPYIGKLKGIDRIAGTLPIFRYPSNGKES